MAVEWGVRDDYTGDVTEGFYSQGEAEEWADPNSGNPNPGRWTIVSREVNPWIPCTKPEEAEMTEARLTPDEEMRQLLAPPPEEEYLNLMNAALNDPEPQATAEPVFVPAQDYVPPVDLTTLTDEELSDLGARESEAQDPDLELCYHIGIEALRRHPEGLDEIEQYLGPDKRAEAEAMIAKAEARTETEHSVPDSPPAVFDEEDPVGRACRVILKHLANNELTEAQDKIKVLAWMVMPSEAPNLCDEVDQMIPRMEAEDRPAALEYCLGQLMDVYAEDQGVGQEAAIHIPGTFQEALDEIDPRDSEAALAMLDWLLRNGRLNRVGVLDGGQGYLFVYKEPRGTTKAGYKPGATQGDRIVDAAVDAQRASGVRPAKRGMCPHCMSAVRDTEDGTIVLDGVDDEESPELCSGRNDAEIYERLHELV